MGVNAALYRVYYGERKQTRFVRAGFLSLLFLYIAALTPSQLGKVADIYWFFYVIYSIIFQKCL